MKKPLSRRGLGKTLAAGADVAPVVLTHMSPAVEKAWRDYQAAVEAARRFVFTRDFCDRPQVRAEANEFFFQIQAASYNWIVAPRVDYPRFFVNTLVEPLVGTSALPCPDFRHRMAFIDGAQTYRIWGKRSNSLFLDLQTIGSWGAEFADEYNRRPAVPHPIDQMRLDADGGFEIIASPDRHEGNWIELDPKQDRMTLIAREAFYDWSAETPSLLRIERIGSTPPRPIQTDDAEFIKRLRQSARYVKFVVETVGSAVFDRALAAAGGQINVFAWLNLGGATAQNPSAVYSAMIYDLGPDEALILEGDAPTSKYWSLQLADRYIRSTDFVYHLSSLNGHNIRLDGDGKFRLVISRKDPGVPNWLDPVDTVPIGMIYYRQFFQAKPADLPAVRKVAFDEVRRHLPADTPVVSPAERDRRLRDHAWALLSGYGY